ncbi:aminoacyl-tRNA hydrolase [Candidatus Peregrinibacteria bacterium]|nr:MAG: aminoacyl-tRNA hydrolase [Candidatus Peregrinibacteria bacterium]
MKVICGLGNPGEKYEKTRHNVGFRALDAFAQKNEFPPFELRGKAWISEKGQGFKKVLLLKPVTFMNLSGEAVQEVLQFYKLEPKNLLVVYDDVDLPLGTLRYREKGSAGTHNGMKSLIQNLATLDFPRLRIGIESRGQSAPEQMPLDAFVLAPFTEEEESVLKNEIPKVCLQMEEWLVK